MSLTICDKKKTHLMLCLTPSSPSPCLLFPPSLSLVAWRRNVGAECSCLLKWLPDDKKLEAFHSLQVVVSYIFFLSFFFCFKCFCQFFSVKLSRQHSNYSHLKHAHSHTDTHTPKITHKKLQVLFFLGSHRRQIWFCVLRLVAMGGRREAVRSQRHLPFH